MRDAAIISGVLLFKNAVVIDGSGNPPARRDVLVDEGRIEAVHPEVEAADSAVVDGAGMALAPGFIDVHSHCDLHVLRRYRAKTVQGVTAEVVGNCGFSAFPCGGHPEEVRDYGNPILCGDSGDPWQWSNAKQYLADAMARSSACHVQSLVGHGTLRTAVAGARQGALSSKELDEMLGLLAESLEQGAIGVSTGLMYAPGSSAPREELAALCRLAAKYGKIYATHMRSYADDLLPSLDEQLSLAREAGCRLQISHLQCVGQRNWAKQIYALEKLEQARDQGIDVEFDSYPYLAGSTVMTQLLPQWALDGGSDALVQRLSDPATRQRILDEMRLAMPQQWKDILVAGVGLAHNQSKVGRDVETLASEQGKEPGGFALDLLLEERGQVTIVSFNQCEENLRALLTHPLCTVISDGFYVRGRPHPRLYGTFPSLLGDVSREKNWLPLTRAIHQITAKPAERFGLAGRGRIAPGYHADLVLFDPATIASPATYEHPEEPPIGIKAVFRDGRLVSPLPN